MNKFDIDEVLKRFGVVNSFDRFGNGHINDTYKITNCDFILQKINTNIFKNPDELMQNIENVSNYLKKKVLKLGGDPERETMTIIKTTNGKKFLDFDGQCYRMFKYISNSITIEDEKSNEILQNAGEGFGRFQRLLEDYPVDSLYEIIPDFHNTPKRVETLKNAVVENLAGRKDNVKDEIEFALEKALKYADIITSELEKGTIPYRVTHNDTKINNILFDADTFKAVCVIDLDTIMPGSALYDFGDALRMAGSNAAEDETDLSLVTFNTEYFKYFTKGFMKEMGDKLTEKEIELLAFSPMVLTLECGIRFLTDYLNGDTYFKVSRENHNLDRARNQFALLRDMESKKEIMDEIITKYK